MTDQVKTRKKLIEVSLPLAAINKACVEDKERKTGHIRNLHKWFAPMPLPAWRAALFASLIDDPSTYLPEEQAEKERSRLFQLIEDLVPLDAIKNVALMDSARAELKRMLGDEFPTVVDPFCGGGSTVLEAQRLGLPCFGSDLNPVPVLMTTMLTAIPPFVADKEPVSIVAQGGAMKTWNGLAGFITDIKYYAGIVRERAWNRLKHLYPVAPDGNPIIAWRWARTVSSQDPSRFGHHTPLVSDWWLSKKVGRRAWIGCETDAEDKITFVIKSSGEPPRGNTNRSGAQCLLSGQHVPSKYIREEGKSGRLGIRLLSFISMSDAGQNFFPPSTDQEALASSAVPEWVPEGDLPSRALGFRVQEYGIKQYSQLFTKRQLTSLNVFSEEVRDLRSDIHRDAIASGLQKDATPFAAGGRGSQAYADCVLTMLGLCVSKMAQANNVLVRWVLDPRNGSAKAVQSFDRHAIPMVWDFVETNPFGGSVGDWAGPVLTTALRALDLVCPQGPAATVRQLDARNIGKSVQGTLMFATDPPYYDNIGYADLSDFFYLWLRRCLREVYPSLFATVLAPKDAELIATPYRHNGNAELAREYFRSGFTEVFSAMARANSPDFPLSVIYAFKEREEEIGGAVATGWDVLLDGLINAGLQVVGTWPIRTARVARMIGVGNNALASAILIVCRAASEDARIGTRRDFVATLKAEMPHAVRKLQRGSIAPVDLAQAAIGPGMAIYSAYRQVLDASGKQVSVRDALALINEVLDEILAEQEGDFDADTRWALKWFEESGFEIGEYGVAETLSKAKNISVQGLKDAGILDKKSPGGKVRLLKPSELTEDWHPETDPRLSVWEVVHHLIRTLEVGGEATAAELLPKLGGKAEVARELAYRLYTICERKKRAQEAVSYNALVQSWPEISRLARESKPATQAAMFAQE